MKFLKYLLFTIVAISLATLAACGGSSGSTDESISKTGTLSVAMVDATTDEYKAVYVTVARVDVHRGDNTDGSWKTVAEPYGTYNLLDLINGVRAELGQGLLSVGNYTQLRMIIADAPDEGVNLLNRAHPYANYIITADDEEIKLDKIPSGAQTGIKIVGGFDINENQTTELILDFDAHRSIVRAGVKEKNIKYLLKPTIKILETREAAIVAGAVTDTLAGALGPNPLQGTTISAQTTDLLADDPKNQVVITTGTISNDRGEYAMFLAPGTYNLVAYKADHDSACKFVELPVAGSATVDFALANTTAERYSISGTVTIQNADPEQYVVINIRQQIPCEGADEDQTIIVRAITVANNDAYEVELAAGEYEVIALTYGRATQVTTVDIESSNAEADFTF